ncbi:MAG: hydroxymethylbilane synthase [Propionibacteriaceae bacterium]|nr:hydroxymethylbilane synthase [Propionibacteriaceae bacterium]
MSGPIRLGTRASRLALTQSGQVARRLRELSGRDVELVHVHSQGDQDQRTPLARLGGTGVFVTALRAALLDGTCDVAVHSLKDLPTEPVEGLTHVTPTRVDPRDALCARDGLTLDALPPGARVGTGSPRRACQLAALRPDVEIVDLRGNVDTRLARAQGPAADLDAVVLALAGLTRLGLDDSVTEAFDAARFVPAPGQGALAVETRAAEATGGGCLAEALAALDDRPTGLAVRAERQVLATLETGCSAPLGAHAQVVGDQLWLVAVAAKPGGGLARVELSHPLDDGRALEAAAAVGARVAEALRDQGVGDD